MRNSDDGCPAEARAGGYMKMGLRGLIFGKPYANAEGSGLLI